MKVLVSHSKYVPEKEFPLDEHDIAHGHTERKGEILEFETEEEFDKWMKSEGKRQKFEKVIVTKLGNIPNNSKFFK